MVLRTAIANPFTIPKSYLFRLGIEPRHWGNLYSLGRLRSRMPDSPVVSFAGLEKAVEVCTRPTNQRRIWAASTWRTTSP